MVQSNAREWLLAEAKLRLPGGEAYARDLVLGPGGAALVPAERSWVEAVTKAPLGLYEAEEVRAGEGISLRDLLRDGEAPVWVADRVASETMREGEALGARLAREGDGEEWGFSGALYPFPKVRVPALVEELRSAEGEPSDPCGRERRWRTIAGQWLRFLGASPLPGEGAAELVGGSADETRAEIRGRFLRESLRGFYQDWANAPLPALGGKTPREAVATAEGRQAVISLLETYEADEAAMAERQGREPLDFGFLWEAVELRRPETKP
ncbi:MAG: DUF2384 domain-containing protein [Deltaproteobacteria bacterium]|nr:DUF2384 domain-containing protein [Deltaproteobacteria bacterium]